MWFVSRRMTTHRPRNDRSSGSRGGRTRWRGRLEGLEERVVLGTFAGDLAMAGATALSPQVVAAQYQVTGGSLTGPMTLGIYRSPTATFGNSSILVGQTTLQGTDLGVGSHQVTVNLSQTLDINPSMKYVLAVADPGDAVAETS